MDTLDEIDDPFTAAAKEAIRIARTETLKAGVPIFYLDRKANMEIMELPDGRKFEIRYIPGAPYDKHYEILRELNRSAA